MDVIIEKFRLSFIWTVLLQEPINGIPLDGMSFLTDKNAYTQKFVSLVGGGSQDFDVSLPWNQQSGSKHNFWSYYLGARVPFDNGQVADGCKDSFWNGCVPFRNKLAIGARIDDEDSNIYVAGYINSFSLSLVATVECAGHYSVEDLWDLAYDIKHNDIFAFEGNQEKYSVHEIAAFAIDELLSTASGKENYAARTEISREPFLIATILKGSAVAALKTGAVLTDAALADLQYTLHDLTGWKNDLFPDRANRPNLPPPEQVLINNKLQPAQGDVFYRQRRGRAIWIPRYFDNTVTAEQPDRSATNSEKRKWKNAFILQKRNQKKIACFHNNILFLTVVLESLCMFVKALDLAFQDKAKAKALSSDIDEWARRALSALTNLYLGKDENISGDLAKDKTYRSLSSAFFIIDNNALASLNSLRLRYNLRSLPAVPQG